MSGKSPPTTQKNEQVGTTTTTTVKTNETSHNKGEGKVTLKFEDKTFKMTFDVKGFAKENIKVHRDGRKITIDCHKTEQYHHESPAAKTDVLSATFNDVQKLKEVTPSQPIDISDELIDRTVRQIGTIPEGVDLKTVKIEVDAINGVVNVTGTALPGQEQPLGATKT